MIQENNLIYLERVGACWYIKGKGIWKGHCMICGKKRKTTAHHLIPKRIHRFCNNENLKEIRLRVCDECHKKLHPENKIIREDIGLKILNKKNKKMQEGLYWREMKLNKIKSMFKKIKIRTEDLTRDTEEILNMSDEEFKDRVEEKREKKKDEK